MLLLVPARTYRAADFLAAAGRMGLDLVVASDGALPLGGRPVVRVSPEDIEGSADRIMARAGPVAAVVAADTPMLPLAAEVAARLGLPHHPVAAVAAAADKAAQRRLWAAATIAQPAFRIVPAAASPDAVPRAAAEVGYPCDPVPRATAEVGYPCDPVPRAAAEVGYPCDAVQRAAAEVGYPCVVKAVSLSASQGVLRADDPAAAAAAATRIRLVLAAAGRPGSEPLLVEEYVPGPELSIDGLLTTGALTVTAVFDKPWTADGPTFEETLLITPSRIRGPLLAEAVSAAAQAARALGLTHGPIHAELRIDERAGRPRPVMLELAARSIGGLCSRALRFGGASLEELVLAHALGRPAPWRPDAGASRPSGVLMLPVPRPGVLVAVEGRAEAAATPGVTGLTITIPVGQQVRPLPEGDRYLGFIFAEGDTHQSVEGALRAARTRLRVVIR